MLAFLTAFLALLLILLLAAGFYWLPRYIDKKTERFQSDLVDRHYAEVENMYRTMRSWRHDYHNHIQAAISYAELGKYRELISYLEQLDESLYEIDQLVRTGNLMVDAILNSKLSLMRENCIRTDVDAHVPSKMKITDPELCVLLGNLLDNAIEASVKIPDPHDRHISVKARVTENGYFTYEITNAKRNAVLEQKGILKSDKEDPAAHGLGLSSVREVVEKYSGTLDLSYTEDTFTVTVLIGNA